MILTASASFRALFSRVFNGKESCCNLKKRVMNYSVKNKLVFFIYAEQDLHKRMLL